MISKEQASPALQALMQTQTSVATPTVSVATTATTHEPQPSTAVAAEPEVQTAAEVAVQPLTATQQIEKLVNKVKSQLSSANATAPSTTVGAPQAEPQVIVKAALDPENLSYSRWLVVVGAGLLLLVLLLFLRRSSTSTT